MSRDNCNQGHALARGGERGEGGVYLALLLPTPVFWSYFEVLPWAQNCPFIRVWTPLGWWTIWKREISNSNIYIYIYVYTYWVRLHRRVTTTIFECSCCTSTVCSWQLYLSVHATAACCSCAVPLLYSSMQLYFCCSAACSWSVQQKKFEPEIKFLKDFFSAKRGDFTHKYWGNTSVNYLKQLIRIKIYKNQRILSIFY